MQGHGRIIAHDFCVAHREANSGLSTLNRTKSILSIYHQQRQLQKQRGMCLNDTYPFCQQPLSGNCHSICFSKSVLWTATPWVSFFVVIAHRFCCLGISSFCLAFLLTYPLNLVSRVPFSPKHIEFDTVEIWTALYVPHKLRNVMILLL